MKIELRSNGDVRIRLEAETPIEAAYLQTMRDGAAKGVAVKLIDGADGSAGEATSIIVAMEK